MQSARRPATKFPHIRKKLMAAKSRPLGRKKR
jgi:hypothetical protein